MFNKRKSKPEPTQIPCPYCGTLMTFGYVQAKAPLVWNKKKRFTLLEPDIMLNDNIFSGAHISSFFCSDCNKIIIDITEHD